MSTTPPQRGTARIPRTPPPPPIAIQPLQKRRRMDIEAPTKKRNAWIIYRTAIYKHLMTINDNIRLDQSKLSCAVSNMWKNESGMVRQKFSDAARLERQGLKKAEIDFDGEFAVSVQRRVQEISSKATKAKRTESSRRSQAKKPMNAGRQRSQTLDSVHLKARNRGVRSASVQPLDTNDFLETSTCSTDSISTPSINTHNQELGSPFLSDTYSFSDTSLFSPTFDDVFTDLHSPFISHCDDSYGHTAIY